MMPFRPTSYRGLLAIGDPHLEARVPGFRCDDYPQVILGKLKWALDYATAESLLPIILGDLFHLPRANPNWLIVELLQMFSGEILGIYGNHDVHENQLSQDDSISILAHSGAIRLLSEENVWAGLIANRPVTVGGTPWGQFLPASYKPDTPGNDALTVWLTHHDISVPGYQEAGRFGPRPIPGIDLIVNGHVHRRLERVVTDNTTWMTPGNISRRSRSDASRHHVPAVMRIDIGLKSWRTTHIEIPHEPFADVFHSALVAGSDTDSEPSTFVAGLAELQVRRTDAGAGLGCRHISIRISINLTTTSPTKYRN